MKTFSLKTAFILTLLGMIQQVYAAGEPQVRFLEPAAGNSGPNLSVVVDASDADGKVREVRLYINNTQVRRERAAPYEWGTANKNSDDPLLLNLAPGSYQLRAVAKDNQNKTASATRNITVLGANSEPSVSASAVQNGESTLNRGDSLSANQYLASSNGAYRFNLQGDGNLVLRDQATGSALWSSKTNGQNGSRLTMQGDGNLVLYTASGSAVWSSKTNGTGAVKAVMQNDGNFVIYTASNAAVWSSDTAQTTDTGGTGTGGGTDTGSGGTDTGGGSGSNDGGGTGGDTANSSGQFSAPSAALYSLNDSRQLGFSQYIDTGFGGNGHAETWDGRIFVRTRTSGWEASAFRPERITRNSDGSVNFKNGAFGNSISLERRDEATDMQHNWIALVKDPAVSGENPYPSNSSGTYSVNGTYATYKAMVIHTSTRNGDNDQMGQRRATFIIQNANTSNAQLVRADFTSAFQKYRLQSGSDFRCIEPSATVDGHLIICQGHPDNNGRIDNLVYSWNPVAGATSNWRAPKSIANMYFDDRNADVAGMPFQIRFPIAAKPLLDATGNDFNRNELVKGAYPWISHDGSELFYQASRDGVDARRTGTTVVGRWTGWTFRYIDGPINKNRHETGAFPTSGKRLFISSPGAFTTMWSPYKDVDNLKLPYSVRGPSYPIFGSNSQDYSEVGFDDYLDGNFVLYYGMNERLDRAGTYLKDRTNDTSGNFNNGTLNGARFPLEFNGRDEIVGRHGQAIYFNGGNYISVDKNKGWDTLAEGASVDFWVKKQSGSGTIRLFNMEGGLEVYLSNGSNLNAAITDTSGTRVTINGGTVSTNNWSHVAFTFDPKDKQMKLYVNGTQVAAKAANGFGTLRTSGVVRIGPQNSSGLLLLDEVKVSNVARRAYEVKHYANVRSNVGPNQALANTIPEHLRSLRFNTTGVDRYSSSAADLGEDLFNDSILSKERTTACSTCHDPASAFTDGLDIARGNEPTDAGVRNTPTLINRLFSSLQGWSGIDGSLDKQALTPIQAQHEMNLPINEAVQRVSVSYGSRFQQVYGESPNAENIAAALASFQVTQFAPKNRVDEYKEGNKTVLSASERRGLDLFEGKARCSGCHAGANFTDESFRHNGLAMNDDIGRADVTGRDRDHKLFKVPSLRELGLTGPYMHDGSISSLLEVVQAYNAGALDAPTRDTDMRPLELSNQEVNDVVAFLGALSENGATGGNTGGNTNVSEVSRVNGILVGGTGSSKPGFTLYVFDNDMGSSGSNCNGNCATAWPPVLVEDSGASGVSGLSTFTRNDGSKQAAYNGRPLYFFANDNSASDIKGDGVNNVWWIADDANSAGGGGSGGNTGGGNSGGNSGGDTGAGGGDTGGTDIGGNGWTQCANENGTCSFSGTKLVAYGANNTFAQKTFTNGISCNNSTFGDPVPGVPKQCWYKNDSGTGTGGGAGSGSITRQVWTGISGTGLSALTGLSSYPNNPTTTDQITSFEAQSNWADNYGTRIVGYLHAPLTGTYTFWIATDDSGELWLSTSDSASNKQRIASISGWAGVRNWTKFASQKSASITLQAGQRYYIEALQKEGGGGDNIAVAWQRPGGSLEVIPGEYLSPFAATIPSDTTRPIITLNGASQISMVQGTAFTDPGATATDNRDGNLTAKISRSGNVNANTVGSYTLTYNVKDAAGNSAAAVQRTVNVESAVSGDLRHIGSTSDYDRANNINISAPSNATSGDLLLLFLSRTDDVLPVRLNGWTAGASCFKTTNGQSSCHEIRQCTNRDGDYCLNFEGGNGRDLATVVFYKTLNANESRNYSFNLRGSKPSWAILSAVRGANNSDPIRNVATESNDGNPDSLFPSVNGNSGDLLLLSMAFDDTTQRDDFRAPSGMDMHQWIAGEDEAGYVYGQKLTRDGQTGAKKTSGPGGSNAKDALISMTIRPSGNVGGGNTGGGNGDGSGDNTGGGDSATGNNTIGQNQQLNANEYIASENGLYRLYLQGDGNIVLRDQQSGAALWSSKTNGDGGTRLVMQSDGNFVLYTASGTAVWASGTNGTGASRVVINNDGSLAIYAGDNPVWAENGTGNTGGNTGGGDSGDGTGGVTQTGTFEKRISSSLDDVEEQSNGSVNSTSTDIELVFDNSDQTVGLRFTGVNIPKGASVTRAYIQFTTDETNSGNASLRIKAHDVDDAPAFTTSSGNVSNRATTNASISWQPAAWNTVGAATTNERTPDIKNMIQEVVSRSGWNSGNDIAIIITGSGERTAESFDGSSGQAPLLHIEYSYTDDGAGGGGTGGNTGGEGTKIAFIGDTGAGGNFQSVLNLIKAEGAELTIVAGDTSYDSSRDDDWDRMVRDTLGSSDPALVVAGNHDYGDSNFGDVRSYGQTRLNRQSVVQCSGAYAEKMTCNYKGIYFVMSAVGASGSISDHESFISNSLNNAPDGAWRICAWHKNQREMQVGGKTDETGWTAYETCRQKGAIISTGHEHSYSRTHLLSDMSSQSVSTKSSNFVVSEGKTFAFVSGLGGVGIRDQERGGDHWAKIYTSSQGARYGAMFGTFYEDRAEFYFKNINGQIIDQFTVMKGY